MPDISVLLPSLRPEAARRVVQAFERTQQGTDYEIVLVSPFPLDAPRVVHVPETERRGVVAAVGAAVAAASAETIVLWSDDAMPTTDCLVRMRSFVEGKPVPFAAGFSKREPSGRVNEQWSVYSRLYVGWLGTTRATIEAVGGLLDPAFKSYWSDPDFCMRIWDAGGTVAVCPDAWVEVVQIDDEVKAGNVGASFEQDTQTFFDRWHGKYGGGRPRVWWRINTQIPNSLGGHIRAVLRQVPYLRELRDAARRFMKRPAL